MNVLASYINVVRYFKKRSVRCGVKMPVKIEILTRKCKNVNSWAGFEPGTSDYQTDALDHLATLDDVWKDEKIAT